MFSTIETNKNKHYVVVVVVVALTNILLFLGAAYKTDKKSFMAFG